MNINAEPMDDYERVYVDIAAQREATTVFPTSRTPCFTIESSHD
jgi:hypothetical protein